MVFICLFYGRYDLIKTAERVELQGMGRNTVQDDIREKGSRPCT